VAQGVVAEFKTQYLQTAATTKNNASYNYCEQNIWNQDSGLSDII
jgi:hypothetical protein